MNSLSIRLSPDGMTVSGLFFSEFPLAFDFSEYRSFLRSFRNLQQICDDSKQGMSDQYSIELTTELGNTLTLEFKEEFSQWLNLFSEMSNEFLTKPQNCDLVLSTKYISPIEVTIHNTSDFSLSDPANQ